MTTQQVGLFNDMVEEPNGTEWTFVNNITLPIHGWFRYSAGFSATWVRQLIEQEKKYSRNSVLDPFAGSATTLLEAESCNVDAIGIEPHPFVWRVARTKLFWYEDHRAFSNYAISVLKRAKALNGSADGYPKLIDKCFPPESLVKLDSLKCAWKDEADGSPYSELTWLALSSILRECSPAGTAPWQYILPKKQKAKFIDPYKAFEAKVILMSADMALRQSQRITKRAVLYKEDARDFPSVPDSWADLVITSPPYANNYDYADATRLEMSFFGDIQGWGDLQETVRRYLIRSCTQHAARLSGTTYKILDEPLLQPIQTQIIEKAKLLESEKEHHGGKKPYHTMIACYFSDMAKMWVELRRVTSNGSLVCFVIGDSAPYGIYVPVHEWLGKLAEAAGFKSFEFEKLRIQKYQMEEP